MFFKQGRLSLVAMVMVMLLLSACGGETASTPTAAGSTGGNTAAMPSGEISYQVFGDPEEIAVFEAVVAGYNKYNPNVKVNLDVVPSQGEYMTKLSASIASGTPPDVFLLNYRRYGQFLGKNQLEPAEDYLAKSATVKKEMFFDVPLKAFSDGGKLQCMPQNISSMVVYYNKDLFQKYNVPLPTDDWTWDQFLDAAKKLTMDTDGDGTPNIYGLGTEASIIRLAPFIWQNGGKLMDDEANPTKMTLTDPASLQAIEFFMNLSNKHKVVPTEAEFRAQDFEARFKEGTLAMTLNSRRVVPVFRTIKGFTWDVAAPPSGKAGRVSVLHSDAYCMAAAGKNKAATWNFVEYAIGKEGQEIAAKLGRTVPSMKDVANSPVFLDPAQAPANSKVFLDERQLRVLPIVPAWPAMEKAINTELEEAFYGHIAVNDAVKLADEMATEAFNKK